MNAVINSTYLSFISSDSNLDRVSSRYVCFPDANRKPFNALKPTYIGWLGVFQRSF